MKRGIIIMAVLLAIVAGIFVTLHFRSATDTKTAAGAEGKGDYAAALAQYVDALYTVVPDRAVPDINRSRVFSQAVWKKTVEEYAAWLSGAVPPDAGSSRRDTLLDAVRRNAARVNADNFISGESRTKLSIEQYLALWNSAFFAASVTPDSGHRPIAKSCYEKSLSFVKVSALSSFSYEVSLIDTVAGRRTAFSVFPESSTLILAPPGAHILICKSSYQPGPGMIWKSVPALIPVTVPSSPSLCSFTLETHVVREKEKK
jgi:hypothetical protein